MKAMLRNLAVLGAIGVACTAGASAGIQQPNSTNGARSEQVAVADAVITPAMSDAINAHAAKANRIAQQIRETAGGMNDASYTNLSLALLGASEAGLDAAASAQSYKMAMTAIRSADETSARGARPRGVRPEGVKPADFQPEALGIANTEFVFYPIVPCRLLDTRANGIMITPWVPYPVDFDGGNAGNAAGCTYSGVAAQLDGSLSGLTRAALAINLTVTGSSVGGWIAARPVGSTNLTSNQNFNAGQDLANLVIVQNAGTTADFELIASQATHAVVDVLGVFAPPLASPLDCVYVSLAGTGTGNVANNSEYDFANSAACSAGYTAVSIHCEYSGASPAGLALTQIGPGLGGGGYFACIWRNQTGGALDGSRFNTHTRCCRIPGR